MGGGRPVSPVPDALPFDTTEAAAFSGTEAATEPSTGSYMFAKKKPDKRWRAQKTNKIQGRQT